MVNNFDGNEWVGEITDFLKQILGSVQSAQQVENVSSLGPLRD